LPASICLAIARGEYPKVTLEPITKPLTILIVDDDERVRHALARCLELDGHVVEVANTGTKALELIASHSWDLLCLDAQLPDIAGDTIARRLRELGKHTFTVLITGFASSLDDRGWLTEGVDAVLPKPWKVDELECILQRAYDYVSVTEGTRAA
jgi:CheY-like chemotaxis protein